jgi:hypothetical protein
MADATGGFTLYTELNVSFFEIGGQGWNEATTLPPVPESCERMTRMNASLPLAAIDLVVVAAANLFNLLMSNIFATRPIGWKRFERTAGLVIIALAVPLGAAVIVNALAGRAWWLVVLPIPLILHCIVECLLDYVLKVDFRNTRLLGPYLGLFYLGQVGLIGYAFVVSPAYGFVTLATYFLCLGSARHAIARGVG